QNIAEKIEAPYPTGMDGLPTTNPQSVWLFPYKPKRTNNEIERLWDFFDAVNQDKVTDESFADVLKIRGIGKVKLTEVLFYVNPEKYFPINSPTKKQLKKVFNISPKFKTYSEYKEILREIRLQSNKPFYQISIEAWDLIESPTNKDDEEQIFLKILQSHSNQVIHNYFTCLDSIISYFDLKSEDNRVVMTTVNGRLNFTIGQRYCWNLYPANEPAGIYGVITTNKINNDSTPFEGGDEVPFYTRLDDYSHIQENQESVYDAIKVELARSIKSGFLKHNNEAFRKAIYDKEYRNYIITTFDLNPFKEKEMKEIISTNFPLNRILYGPPGTGKTYKLKKDYFS